MIDFQVLSQVLCGPSGYGPCIFSMVENLLGMAKALGSITSIAPPSQRGEGGRERERERKELEKGGKKPIK